MINKGLSYTSAVERPDLRLPTKMRLACFHEKDCNMAINPFVPKLSFDCGTYSAVICLILKHLNTVEIPA